MSATTVLSQPKIKAHHYRQKLMGSDFFISAVDLDPQKAWDAIRAGVAEIERIERLISSWTDESETADINAHAGIKPVQVSKELFDLISRSLKVSELTAGAFDISGTLARFYWNFDNSENVMIPDDQIIELRDLINYHNIQLDRDNQTVFLANQGMKIGFGGIGKGYAAWRAHEVMSSFDIHGGMINASGDLMCWGLPPNKSQWDINIIHPEDSNQRILKLSIPKGSIVTSGCGENYTIIDNIKYSHIVDPRTGRPVVGTKSVSIICPNPELGDALATAISVMGGGAGIDMVNRLNGIECIVVTQDDEILYSEGL